MFIDEVHDFSHELDYFIYFLHAKSGYLKTITFKPFIQCMQGKNNYQKYICYCSEERFIDIYFFFFLCIAKTCLFTIVYDLCEFITIAISI